MLAASKIAPCLWFDSEAEHAVAFYTRIFKNSRVVTTSYYGEAGREVHGRPPGSVMAIGFELERQSFTALNGGPLFRFNEAVSLQVNCASQEEIDYYWNALTVESDPAAQQCGWLKDRFGLSWQVVPDDIAQTLSGPDAVRAGRAMVALMKMKKIDLAALRNA
ncbi:MAG TPA: VOC family protein [Casimicrobiaceae bacterium]|nr:VOC family protein [Casimicrobiaceae bacterium]